MRRQRPWHHSSVRAALRWMRSCRQHRPNRQSLGERPVNPRHERNPRPLLPRPVHPHRLCWGSVYEEIRLHEQTSGRPHERDMQQRAPRVSPPSPTETGPRHWSKSHQRQRRPKQGTIHQKKADGARYVPRMGPAPSLRQLGAPRKHWTRVAKVGAGLLTSTARMYGCHALALPRPRRPRWRKPRQQMRWQGRMESPGASMRVALRPKS
mmetsp:Transcript_30402/g.41244  ORF Transcript_30402/g.41244 Transcript_30402/m.41244 type:complete len:209 (+) Transcript_30402:581-1207(+)